ncbi:MAG: hypothetical protein AB4063_19395 [Crocosphaera sp.]
MKKTTSDFCFCTLAFSSYYRQMAKELAEGLEEYAPGTKLVVGTDDTQDFKNCKNVISYHQKQQGILHCYHDKRIPIAYGLSKFKIAILIDADCRITSPLPQEIEEFIGIQGVYKSLVEHTKKYRPERLETIEKIAKKMNIDSHQVSYFGEALLMVSRDGQKSEEFINAWGKIGLYLELAGIHSGSGIAIGLAAYQVGWTSEKNSDWQTINRAAYHLDASRTVERTSWEQLQRRLSYHYRLNKQRLLALRDFNFYYG